MLLKTQNIPMVVLYTIFNFTVFFILYKNSYFSIEIFENIFQDLSRKDGLFFILLPLLLVFLQGILPSNLKEILVFWKIKNRLPGCEAFSKYLEKDNRVDKDNLTEKYGSFPTDKKKQNILWYKIFKDLSEKNIDKTHKDFLLFREISIITILFIPILPAILWYFSKTDNKILMVYTVFLIFEYLIVRYIAKNHAIRLVTNVLALASTKS